MNETPTNCASPTGCDTSDPYKRPLMLCSDIAAPYLPISVLHLVGEQDGFRNFAHGFAIVHTGSLNLAECIRLR